MFGYGVLKLEIVKGLCYSMYLLQQRLLKYTVLKTQNHLIKVYFVGITR